MFPGSLGARKPASCLFMVTSLKRRPSNVYSENYPCAAIAYPVPVRLAVRGAAVLLRLRVQAGKWPALPVGHRRDDYLLCKKRHYPPCAGVSNQPDGTSAAGGAGTWQAARRERCHEKLHP